jgi:hypothetical protein
MRWLTLLILSGCISVPGDSPTEVFDYVWGDFDAMYGGFDHRGVDWDAAYDTWGADITDDSTDDELHEALTGLVAELNDGHVRLVAPGREVFWSNDVYRERPHFDSFDLSVVQDHYLEPQGEPSEWYVRGTIDGTPYVWFDWIDDNTYVVGDIVNDNPHADKIIIDLRHNGGGSFNYARKGLAALTDTERVVFRSRTRNGPERGQFDDWFEWTMPPSTDATFTGKVVVLMDRYSMSATERAIMMLRTIPGAVFVGTPSNGSIATSIGREAPNRWTYTLAVQEVEGPDGTVYEGVGLPVDIEVLNDPAVLATGTDEALEAALAVQP